MSLTIAKVKHFNPIKDGVRESVFDVTFDGSYPSGGYDFAAANLGFGFKGLYDVKPNNLPGGFAVGWDAATSKLLAFKVGSAGAMTECATTDVQNQVVRLSVRGW